MVDTLPTVAAQLRAAGEADRAARNAKHEQQLAIDVAVVTSALAAAEPEAVAYLRDRLVIPDEVQVVVDIDFESWTAVEGAQSVYSYEYRLRLAGTARIGEAPIACRLYLVKAGSRRRCGDGPLRARVLRGVHRTRRAEGLRPARPGAHHDEGRPDPGQLASR